LHRNSLGKERHQVKGYKETRKVSDFFKGKTNKPGFPSADGWKVKAIYKLSPQELQSETARSKVITLPLHHIRPIRTTRIKEFVHSTR